MSKRWPRLEYHEWYFPVCSSVHGGLNKSALMFNPHSNPVNSKPSTLQQPPISFPCPRRVHWLRKHVDSPKVCCVVLRVQGFEVVGLRACRGLEFRSCWSVSMYLWSEYLLALSRE